MNIKLCFSLGETISISPGLSNTIELGPLATVGVCFGYLSWKGGRGFPQSSEPHSDQAGSPGFSTAHRRWAQAEPQGHATILDLCCFYFGDYESEPAVHDYSYVHWGIC